jgi:hypothetical protein
MAFGRCRTSISGHFARPIWAREMT